MAQLKDLGIPVMFHDETMSQATPVTFGLIARQIIYVGDAYYDRALAYLVEMGVVDEEDLEDDELDFPE